ncbi:terpenoid cyclases/Protein prenyltransferase [Nadsonia fulvescens var. elongata DSM 6958]|uniref:Geranylgeranyl transferase type-2 subunit beta n=1 Tax=Nadsonia fulvescens var. elongata DSM 6958 TaxID=857566 RepID=A0A1E3PFV2_9ASCO|nr:terpenoid cyclases/Protein prenyltransferase [Nadsonia fulvescens var. elongata DSM 6958]
MAETTTQLKYFKEKHIAYIKDLGEKTDELEYWLSEHLRMNGLYWGLTALALMGSVDTLDRADVIAYVKSCQHTSSGGFGASPSHDAHLLSTLSALQILVILDAVDTVDEAGILRYVRGLQDSTSGAIYGDSYGESDTRFVYIAFQILSILGELNSNHPQFSVEKSVDFIMACANLDGGFGMVPGAESHAAQIFTALGALTISNQMHRVDKDLLSWWLCERQLPCGGLNGRPEKLPDVCYSWWVVSSLAMLGRVHWIDGAKLTEFILEAQDEEAGGIADRKGDQTDVFHTLFGTAGLSLLGYEGLEEINPVYCLPNSVMHRVRQPPATN